MSWTCQTCGYTEHYGMHSCAEELKKEIARLREDAERWRWWRSAPQSEVLRLSHYAFDALDVAVDKVRSVT